MGHSDRPLPSALFCYIIVEICQDRLLENLKTYYSENLCETINVHICRYKLYHCSAIYPYMVGQSPSDRNIDARFYYELAPHFFRHNLGLKDPYRCSFTRTLDVLNLPLLGNS